MKRWCTYIAFSLWLLLTTNIAAAPLREHELLSSSSKNLAESGPTAAPILGIGSTGTSVKDLQAMLTLMGYYTGPVDGRYQQATADAVKRFQMDAGLPEDGLVGPITWQRLLPTPAYLEARLSAPQDEPQPQAPEEDSPPKIDGATSSGSSDITLNLPVLQLNDSGEPVTRLQRQLAARNLYSGSIDGEFGEQTEAAVKLFQQQAGLTSDGIVGPATWSALLDP